MNNQSKKIFLFGFGDINQRLSRLLLARGHEVSAFKRSAMNTHSLPILATDLSDPNSVKNILAKSPEQIVITVSPSEYTEQGYRNSYLKIVQNLINQSADSKKLPEIVFISSSSIYSEDQGAWVNEQTAPKPIKYNGQVLLEAESALEDSPMITTSLRFSGIYGPGRYRLIQSALKNNANQQIPPHWTNRIHADDCARAIDHILHLPASDRQPLYLATDSAPIKRAQVQNWIREQCEEKADLVEQIQTAETGKRCDNSLLVQSGFEFLYPSYKEGFKEIISQFKIHSASN